MEILKEIANCPGEILHSCVTIGNFDGCHLGHQKLLEMTLKHKQDWNSKSIAITFDPNPKFYFGAPNTNQHLFTTEMKREFFHQMGFDYFVEQPFDESFSRLTPERFYHLINSLHPKSITVGSNFLFGYKRQGDCKFLMEKSQNDQFIFDAVEAVTVDDQPVSSSRIREALQTNGDISTATQLLTRPYFLLGQVIHGRKEGRKIGFPTANLGDVRQIIPKNGVYCGFVSINPTNKITPFINDRQKHPAVLNIGTRPTYQDTSQSQSVEIHILSSSDLELYDNEIGFQFIDRIRDERKFTDISALREQISQDVSTAKRLLS